MVLKHLKIDDGLNICADLSKASTQIAADLNAIFQHEIDPSYADDQTDFKTIHDGKPPEAVLTPMC